MSDLGDGLSKQGPARPRVDFTDKKWEAPSPKDSLIKKQQDLSDLADRKIKEEQAKNPERQQKFRDNFERVKDETIKEKKEWIDRSRTKTADPSPKTPAEIPKTPGSPGTGLNVPGGLLAPIAPYFNRPFAPFGPVPVITFFSVLTVEEPITDEKQEKNALNRYKPLLNVNKPGGGGGGTDPNAPIGSAATAYVVTVTTRLISYFPDGSEYNRVEGRTVHQLAGPIGRPRFKRHSETDGGNPRYQITDGLGNKIGCGAYVATGGDSDDNDWRGGGVLLFEVTRLDGTPEPDTSNPAPPTYNPPPRPDRISFDPTSPPAHPGNPSPPSRPPAAKPTPVNNPTAGGPPAAKPSAPGGGPALKPTDPIADPPVGPLKPTLVPIGTPIGTEPDASGKPEIKTNPSPRNQGERSASGSNAGERSGAKSQPGERVGTGIDRVTTGPDGQLNRNPTTTKPTTTTPTTTTPTPKPTPEKERVNQIPPLFTPVGPVSPTDPNPIPKNEPNKPIDQTPPANSCCVPGPVMNSLKDIGDKLKPTDLADLTLLKIINDKLGPQLNGGIASFLKRLDSSRLIDRGLNIIGTAASVHNAYMLSSNLGVTFLSMLANIFAIAGIKDSDGNAFNFAQILGDTTENLIKTIIGEDDFTHLKAEFARANRIITAATQIKDAVFGMLHATIDGLNTIGGWIAKIGNGLSSEGILSDFTIPWFPENPDFKSPLWRFNERISTLTNAVESVDQVASQVINIQDLTTQIQQNANELKTAIENKSAEKTAEETIKTNESKSPAVDKIDLVEGAPGDGS